MSLGNEIIRVARLARDHRGPELLTEVLNGRELTVENCTKLFAFVLKYFDERSPVADALWAPIQEFLSDAGASDEQLQTIRHPQRSAGSILEEFLEEGLISKQDYEEISQRGKV